MSALGLPALRWATLDQRICLCRDDASEREAGGSKERAQIRFGALHDRDKNQHHFSKQSRPLHLAVPVSQ